MIFKGVYLVALLVLAMLSTAAVVYSVASIYSAKELSFSRVLSVVPKVRHTCFLFVLLKLCIDCASESDRPLQFRIQSWNLFSCFGRK
jgi:hypothetical protein